MNKTKKMILAALFLALGMILPFFTGQIPAIGSRLLPMHIPVLLCGFVCGWQYGLIVGLIVPVFRSMIFSMPRMMPTAVAMSFELATYGVVAGFLYARFSEMYVRFLRPKQFIYISLFAAMIAGRLVWGLVSIPLYGIVGQGFSVAIFVTSGFVNAVPGIILQIIVVPVIVMALEQTGVLRNGKESF